MRRGRFEHGAAAGAFGKQDFGDIKQWIDPRDLKDVLADQMHVGRGGVEIVVVSQGEG